MISDRTNGELRDDFFNAIFDAWVAAEYPGGEHGYYDFVNAWLGAWLDQLRVQRGQTYSIG